LTLFVAQMSWLNPEITNLVPVLKSYWLAIHVAVITGSYGFLGVSAIIGLLNLILASLVKPANKERVQRNIRHMTWINEAAMTLGLYLLTIGTFLGASGPTSRGGVTGDGIRKRPGRLLPFWSMHLSPICV